MDLTLQMLARRVPEIIAAAVRERRPIEPVVTCPAGPERAAAAMAPPPAHDDPAWRPLRRGERWGIAPGDAPDWDPPRLDWEIAPTGGSTHWLRADLELPPAWRGRAVQLELLWEGARLDQVESIVALDGAVIAGLDWGHRTLTLPASAHTGRHELLIRSTVAFPRPFLGLELQLRDESVYRLGQRMRALLDAANTLAADAPARPVILRLLDEAYATLDLRAGYGADGFVASAAVALERLEAGLEALPPHDTLAPRIVGTGHGHLDVAWLWPLWRTRQKIAHTVATALDLMERYPDYHFSLSQPQVYAYLKADAPELYERLRQRVIEGRIEPVGMMWVEPDGNVPSGESFVRQLLYGGRFFAQEFPERYGEAMAHPHVVWLPDAFGFSAALPQILRGAGVSCFMTNKLSWNQANRMPADTFRWRGIDGSEVLAHFLTASDAPPRHPSEPQSFTYCSMLSAGDLMGCWRHYKQRELNSELLYLYGHGDGGGGPAEEMLEAARTFARLPGLPRLELGRADRFFAELYGRVWGDPALPSWSGELTLEYHRGTLTSQAGVKAANRRAELRYREAEWLNAWAVTAGGRDRQGRLDEGWAKILLNQFHDILPGSSIAAVYADARADYAEVEAIAAETTAEAIGTILGDQPAGPLVLNTLPWERDEVVRLPIGSAAGALPGESQPVEERPGEPALLARAWAPAYGYAGLGAELSTPRRTGGPLRAARDLLESDALRVELDEHGEIASLYDRRHGRELALPGATLNRLVCYEDRPLAWDAWDIDHYYARKAEAVHEIVAWEVVERGPLRAAVQIVRRTGASTATQRICLWRDLARVDFVTEVDWQERQRLLRALFPLRLNVERATCEIQFGALERPTHRNTSWEQARFEVAAQRWVDLSEGDYGVALLNDGKYGHSFEGSTVGLSLLKGAIFPDPDADRGPHRFTYSLLPHAGDWRAAQVVRRAYELNAPLQVLGQLASTQAAPASRSFLSTDCEHIVVETVKAAADGDGLIVRLYEAHNRRGPARLSFERQVLSAEETDLLERPGETLPTEGNSIQLSVRPYELKTLRVRLGDSE